MRIFNLIAATLLIGLGGCSSAPDNSKLAAVEAKAEQSAADDGRILCALDGAEKFGRDCTMDRVAAQTGQELVVSGSNGGFRRLRVLTNGKGVEVADGAEPAKLVMVADGLVEVQIGKDRYRIPAAKKAADKPAAAPANSASAPNSAAPATPAK